MGVPFGLRARKGAKPLFGGGPPSGKGAKPLFVGFIESQSAIRCHGFTNRPSRSYSYIRSFGLKRMRKHER